MSGTGSPEHRLDVSVTTVFEAVRRRQTYKNLLYLLVAFPLALTYWTVVLFGFAFGIALSVVVVGFAVLFVTLVIVRYIAGFERRVANALLPVSVQDPEDRTTGETVLGTARGYLDAPSTWKGLGYVSVKFWLGIVGILLFVFLWTALELLTAVVRYPVEVEFGTVNDQPVAWAITSLPEALLAIPLGVVLGIVVLNVANGFAYVAGRIVSTLLGSEQSVAAPTGESSD